VTDSADALQRYKGRLSHILDFPLSTALRETFGTGQWHIAHFDNYLNMYDRFMVAGPGRVSFLDNHDMNRFIFVADGDVNRLKMAALCQFTLSPTPIIYYGTEIGLSQQTDKDADGFGGDHHVRADMPWQVSERNGDLLSFYRQLIHLRKEESSLRNGRRQRIHLNSTNQTYAYTCDNLLIAFNLSDVEQSIPLPNMTEGAAYLITTGNKPVIRSGSLSLAGKTAVIIKLGL
jgi:glycosidase